MPLQQVVLQVTVVDVVGVVAALLPIVRLVVAFAMIDVKLATL